MKWLDPMPTGCPACGGRFPVPVADLRSLRAACPACGASLAAVGERMLAEETRVHRLVDLLCVALDLEEHDGLVLTDGEIDAAQSLEDLVCAVAGRLHREANGEARAAELVAAAARRVAPGLLGEAASGG